MRQSHLSAGLALCLWTALGLQIAQAQELPQVANATKFSQPKLIPTALDDTPFDIEAVDVDNDGDMDLVWTSRGSSSSGDAVMWNENLGGGEFGSARTIDAFFSDPRALATGDLNGDGLIDVVSGSNSADMVVAYLNQGVSPPLESIEVTRVAQTNEATALLTSTGEVLVVGTTGNGVQEVPTFGSPVVDITGHTYRMFSASLADGSEVAWGYNGCGETNSDWMTEKSQFRMAHRYGIGVNPDSTLSHIGCSNYGIEQLPTDTDYVNVWVPDWDQYWAGAIRADGSVVMWGREANGNMNVPDSLGPVAKADGGYWYTLALLEDGTITSWGLNNQNVVASTPDLTDVIDISAGWEHAIALTSDGVLHSWGYNGHGEQNLPDFDGPVVRCGTGLYSTWAITASGEIYMWGNNNSGKNTEALGVIDQLAAGLVNGVNADTTFSYASTVYQGTDVHALTLADFDGDGDLDVLSGGCNDQDVAWYENDGNGGFDGSRNLLAEDIQCVRSVLAVDIDLDGDPDAVTLTEGGQLSWFENIAQGNFGPQFLIAGWGQGWDIESADLNNDGNPDLVIKDDNGCFRWYANPGPVGDWYYQQEQCPPTGNSTERAFVLVDLIGDDGLDVVTSSWQHGNASLEISVNRNGYFDETYSAVSLPTGGAGLRGLTSADIDGDGDMDLVATDWDGDRVFWLAQEPSTAPTALRTTIDPASTNVMGLAYGDVDGDGDMDLVSADHSKDHVELYFNDGGSFEGPNTISNVDAYRVEMADINGDGHMDVLVAGGDSDRVEYIPGNGDGTFGEPVVVSDATNTVWGVSAADLDNDGDLDVVSASRDDDKFAWYKNLGNGNFGPQQILTILIDQPFDVATSDVDNDGDMDILGITIEGGDRLIWFENQGGGLFSQYNQIAGMGGNPYKLHMADLNGDGTEDALVANESDDRVSYYPNLGSGQWGSEVVVTRQADGCQSVFAVDVDLDGDLDILSASGNDDKVAWYENLDSDEFGAQQPFTIGRVGATSPNTRSNQYRSVVAFDADGDGDVDVVAGAEYGGLDLFGNLLGENVGCGDVTACNYDPSATAAFGCQFDCYGCTQEGAENYDANASIDDGSCLIPVEGCSNISGIYSLCTDNLVDTVLTYCPDDPTNAIQMYILSGALENLADYLYVYDGADTTATLLGEPLTDQLNDNLFQATNESGCLTVRVVTDVSLSCVDGFFNPIKYIMSCGYEEYTGCMDVEACNYNPEAIIDDGSCAELDCLGVCDGVAVTDDVCGVCVDVDSIFNSVPSVPDPLVVNYLKEDYALNSSDNWDWITEDVALFRNNNGGLFNAFSQEGWENYVDGTLWGPPYTSDLNQFTPYWQDLMCNLYGDCSYACQLPGQHQTLYIESTGQYYDIEYTQWTCGNNGGGLSYTRTEVVPIVPIIEQIGASVSISVDTVRFEVTGQIENWQVPSNAISLRIEAIGAQGGSTNGENGGLGALMSGDFDANEGFLEILVGEAGLSAVGSGYGGGGGSFVVSDGVPLIIAGGGGGAGGDMNDNRHANITENGNLSGIGCDSPTTIGFKGNGCSPGGAGGGFYSSPASAYNSRDGKSYLDGAYAGTASGIGGFGGGGGSDGNGGGGGGGYTGGAGNDDDDSAGGGGSYNTGANQVNERFVGYGHGSVTIIVYSVIGSNCAPGCMDVVACNYDPLAVEDDGTCEYTTCEGCVDEGACNYDETATISDADQCDYYTCLGCTDEEACNYDETATIDAEDCIYPTEDRDCDGNCYVDTDGDGVCDGEEVLGCTYPQATNYNPFATEENGSCVFDGVTDVFGCIYPSACNFNPEANSDDGSCFYAEEGYDCSGVCLFDSDNDGICNQFEGCTNTLACNYDPQALDNDGTCVFPPLGYDCDGGCLYDSDGDGVCDNFEFPGCMDVEACNYYDAATDDDGSCVYAEYGYDCAGYCLGDADNDGVCDLNEVEGCTIESACNYDPEATENDGSCDLPVPYYNCDGSCMHDDDGDGVCDEFEVPGCTYMEADNFDAEATDDDGSCTFYDIYGTPGCMNILACNYNILATIPDNSCEYPEVGYDCDGNCLQDTNGDGICDSQFCDGADFCGEGTVWDEELGVCVTPPSCMGDLNGDQEITVPDLLLLLTVFATECE